MNEINIEQKENFYQQFETAFASTALQVPKKIKQDNAAPMLSPTHAVTAQNRQQGIFSSRSRLNWVYGEIKDYIKDLEEDGEAALVLAATNELKRVKLELKNYVENLTINSWEKPLIDNIITELFDKTLEKGTPAQKIYIALLAEGLSYAIKDKNVEELCRYAELLYLNNSFAANAIKTVAALAILLTLTIAAMYFFPGFFAAYAAVMVTVVLADQLLAGGIYLGLTFFPGELHKQAKAVKNFKNQADLVNDMNKNIKEDSKILISGSNNDKDDKNEKDQIFNNN